MGNSISSMTGFARVDGAHKDRRWTWELKSVNGRGLEMRFRMPQGFDALEPSLRASAKQKLSRGSVNVTLDLQTESTEPKYRLNETALADAITMIETIKSKVKCEAPRPEGILSLRGVMEPAKETDDEKELEALFEALLQSFAEAVSTLAAGRKSEGASMAGVLLNQIEAIELLTADARNLESATPAAIKERIEAQLKELLASKELPQERLAQEAAMLAVKADIREELDRLVSHAEAARALLKNEGPVGRQLDFLTQEFNREANTLCAKVADMDLKRIGLDLKKTVDQMREQVQNIE